MFAPGAAECGAGTQANRRSQLQLCPTLGTHTFDPLQSEALAPLSIPQEPTGQHGAQGPYDVWRQQGDNRRCDEAPSSQSASPCRPPAHRARPNRKSRRTSLEAENRSRCRDLKQGFSTHVSGRVKGFGDAPANNRSGVSQIRVDEATLLSSVGPGSLLKKWGEPRYGRHGARFEADRRRHSHKLRRGGPTTKMAPCRPWARDCPFFCVTGRFIKPALVPEIRGPGGSVLRASPARAGSTAHWLS